MLFSPPLGDGAKILSFSVYLLETKQNKKKLISFEKSGQTTQKINKKQALNPMLQQYTISFLTWEH